MLTGYVYSHAILPPGRSSASAPNDETNTDEASFGQCRPPLLIMYGLAVLTFNDLLSRELTAISEASLWQIEWRPNHSRDSVSPHKPKRSVASKVFQ